MLSSLSTGKLSLAASSSRSCLHRSWLHGGFRYGSGAACSMSACGRWFTWWFIRKQGISGPLFCLWVSQAHSAVLSATLPPYGFASLLRDVFIVVGPSWGSCSSWAVGSNVHSVGGLGFSFITDIAHHHLAVGVDWERRGIHWLQPGCSRLLPRGIHSRCSSSGWSGWSYSWCAKVTPSIGYVL